MKKKVWSNSPGIPSSCLHLWVRFYWQQSSWSQVFQILGWLEQHSILVFRKHMWLSQAWRDEVKVLAVTKALHMQEQSDVCWDNLDGNASDTHPVWRSPTLRLSKLKPGCSMYFPALLAPWITEVFKDISIIWLWASLEWASFLLMTIALICCPSLYFRKGFLVGSVLSVTCVMCTRPVWPVRNAESKLYTLFIILHHFSSPCQMELWQNLEKAKNKMCYALKLNSICMMLSELRGC